MEYSEILLSSYLEWCIHLLHTMLKILLYHKPYFFQNVTSVTSDKIIITKIICEQKLRGMKFLKVVSTKMHEEGELNE